MNIIIILTIIITLFYIYNNSDRKYRINKKLPGPIGLPFFGHFLFLSGDVHYKLFDWYKKYGSIYRLKIGPTETVVITGYPTLRKAFIENSDTFSNRFQPKSRYLLNDCTEMVWENGERHVILKKLLLSEMTTIRLKRMEHNIIKETEKLIGLLDQHSESGKPFELNSYLHMFSLNIILRFTFGVDYPYDQVSQTKGIIKAVGDFLSVAGNPVIYDLIPIINKPNTSHHPFFSNYKVLTQETEKLINKYKESKENNQHQDENEYEPILEKLINEYNKGTIKWGNVVNTAIDLLAAGSDTTSNTMLMGIAALTNNQDIQLKLYENIKSNIDSTNQNDKPILILHSKYRSSIPYVTMVIKETMRKFPSVPCGITHVTSKDVTIDGHTISEGTQIIQNIYASHRSDEFFSNPDKFIPERFSEHSNLNYGSKTNLSQFGCGVRDCVGKALAESQMFTLLSTLFNRYQFINPDLNVPIQEEPDFGFTVQPKQIKIIIKKR